MDRYLQARILLAGSAFAAALLYHGCGNPAIAQDGGKRVDLSVRITPGNGERVYKLFRVEFRKSNGELLRQEVKGIGDKTHYKDLVPGIYVLCITGEMGQQRCESVDLTPVEGQKSSQFSKDLPTPSISLIHTSLHRVSARSLAVPTEARDELTKAEDARLKGNATEALSHLRRALKIYPDYPEALNNVGVHHQRRYEYQEAVRYFRRATEIEPDFFPGWVNLGGSLLSLAQFDAALTANLRALSLHSNDALPNSQLALNYYYLRKYDEAKKYFQRVQELDPLTAASPLLFLAHIALVQKLPLEAEGYIRSYLELHPNSPAAIRLRKVLGNAMTREALSQGTLDLTVGP